MATQQPFADFSDESSVEDDRQQLDSESESDSDQDIIAKLHPQKTAPTKTKDAEEEELERLVLGGKASFRDNLFSKNDALSDLELLEKERQLQLGKPGDGGPEPGLEDVDDADLFTLDVATAPSAAGKKSAAKEDRHAGEAAKEADAPAWEDSDDERLTVSLAGVSQLRKLRIAEGEDVVSGAEYARRLRRQYLALNPLPGWAKDPEGRPAKRRRRSSAAATTGSDSSASSDEDDDSDGDLSAAPLEKLLRDVGRLAGRNDASKKHKLRPEVIDIQRTRPIPDAHKAPVNNLSFHPEYPVLLSSSTSSLLYLHHINPTAQPTPNPMLTSVQAKQVDVRRAEFLYPSGEQIFFAGRRRYFHSWDLQSGNVQKTTRIQGHMLEHRSMERFRLSPCGRYMGIVATTKKGGGIVNIISVASRQWVAAARLDSRHGVADFTWWSNGEGMAILGRDGQVGEYGVAQGKFVGVWRDEGCVGGTVIALGGHQGPDALGEDRWVAVGSSSGVTNIYDRGELLAASSGKASQAGDATVKENPEPTRRFEQLVTSISVLTFSPDGQLLAFGSQQKKDALRLAHLPSCTVYRNWPTEKTPLGRVTAVAFGTKSDQLAVGNDSGKIRLWEIRS